MRNILSSIPPRPPVSRPILAVAVLCASAAAWLSQGTIGATGPAALLVWLAVALSLVSSAQPWRRWTSARLSALVASRPRTTAALLACAIYGVAAWQVSPSVPGGDEPHYLIITQSVLQDGDLQIENNHRAGDYRAYFAGDLSKPDYRRRGRNGAIYSIHAPGLPLLIAPAFAIAGYPGVVAFLVLLASAGSALGWHLAWLATRRAGAAWFGWAAVTLSTSAIFHSFTVYPDGAGGVLVLTGVWALFRAEEQGQSGDERVASWAAHGAALALLPWVHTRFVLIAASLGAVVLLRLGTNRDAAGKAVAFLAIPAVSALCWVGFFISIYGTPDPSFPYANEEGSASFIPGGLAGLLFDQRFGLLAYAPVLVSALAGLGSMVRDRASRRLGLELLFVVVPYLLSVTHFAMWWGGTSAPARFIVPMLPLLMVPAAFSWTTIRCRATRATMLAALALTAFVSASLVLVGGGRLAYNTRQGYAAFPEWVNRATDLPRGLPAWWRGSEPVLYRDAAVWMLAMAAAWLVLRNVEGTRPMRTRGALAAATAAAYGVAAMCAVTTLWTFAGVRGTAETPGQLELLRRVGTEDRFVLRRLPSLRRVAREDVARMLRITPPPSTTPGGAGQNDRPLYQLAAVPAGRYRLEPHGPAATGWLMIGIGRDQFSIVSGPLASPPAPIVLDFPVDVRAIVVRGDEQARRSVTGVTIEPLSIVMPGQRVAPGTAARAVRYPSATTYFMDDRSFPEPEAFWVGGGRTSSVVVQTDAPQASLALVVRNGPRSNHVQLRAGTWAAEVPLRPGEEREVAVPASGADRATLLTISATTGFRPSDVDPASRDTRFLGVWVRLTEPPR
jgi:hypothetical protein